jgi:hypothetical protein
MKHARADYQKRIVDTAKKGGIPKDEPVFLLRAQDATAASVVRYWAALNLARPDVDHKAVELATQHAAEMDKWPKKKTADVPKK